MDSKKQQDYTRVTRQEPELKLIIQECEFADFHFQFTFHSQPYTSIHESQTVNKLATEKLTKVMQICILTYCSSSILYTIFVIFANSNKPPYQCFAFISIIK